MLKRTLPSSPSSPTHSSSSAPAAAPSTPVPAAVAVIAPPATTDQRYLYAVIALCYPAQVLRDDLWHMATTMPRNFLLRCEEFEEELKDLAAQQIFTREKGKILFTKIVTEHKLRNIIVGDSGVNYTMTRPQVDPTQLAVHTRHIAHAAIYEKITGTLINGCDHVKKNNNIRGGLENVKSFLTRLDKYLAKEALSASQQSAIQARIVGFIHYLDLHLQLCDAAIAYNHATQKHLLNPNLKPVGISDYVANWNPNPMQHVTPGQCTPSVYDLRTMHLARVYGTTATTTTTIDRAAKAARLTPDASAVAAASVPVTPPRASRLLFPPTPADQTPLRGLTTQFAAMVPAPYFAPAAGSSSSIAPNTGAQTKPTTP